MYSYIADLVRGVVYLYHFHDFENVVVLDVRKELAKGAHVYDLPKLFPRTNAAADFDYRARSELAARKKARLPEQELPRIRLTRCACPVRLVSCWRCD